MASIICEALGGGGGVHELHTSKHKNHLWDGFHRAPDAAACQPCGSGGDGGGGGGGGGGGRSRNIALLDNGQEAEVEVDSSADAEDASSSSPSYAAGRHKPPRGGGGGGGGGGETPFASPALAKAAHSLTEIALKAGRGRHRPCSPRHRMPFNQRSQNQHAFDDVASNICRLALARTLLATS